MIDRRRFLLGAAGLTGAALAPSLLSRLAYSEPRRAPVRLLILHKPVGTIPEHYDCAGDGRDFVLNHILSPFADLREHMVIVDGLENRKQADTPGEDHGNGIVTFLTGGIPYRPAGSSIPLAELPSIDQIFANDPRIAGETPIRSLQLTADDRGHQFFLRVLSNAGRGMPLPPEENPLAAFARVFGTLADREVTPEVARQLRARQQSILDFTRDDLTRLHARVGATERARLDRHLTAIREVERVAHQVADFDSLPIQREARAAAIARDQSRDLNHAQIGRAHLDLVRAAFQCDLTRIVCFTWGSWTTNVRGMVPTLEGRTYHELSHAGRPADEVVVHHWYNEQLAAYLKTLRDTPDVDGRSLLDNTLVVSWSEMRTGSHTFDNIPVQLFGGAGGRLAGGRLVRYPGFSTNDLWRTIANVLGDAREVFGDPAKNTGRLARLFDDVPLDEIATNVTKASR